MDCKTAKEYMNMYVDNMLDEAEKDQLLLHVQSCAQCKKDYDHSIRLKEVLSGLGNVDPPEGLAQSAIKKARKKKVPAFAYISAGVAAAVALVIILSSNFTGAPMRMLKQTQDEDAGYTEAQELTKAARTDESEMLGMAEEEAMMADEPADMSSRSETEEAAPESAMDDSAEFADAADICFISVPADRIDFQQAVDRFLADEEISVEYYDAQNGTIVEFTLQEHDFEAFESLILEMDVAHDGVLYPDCVVQITFIE